MSEQQFGWNSFENEVVIRGKQDKKRMIVLVFSNFICIPYNRKSFDELVDLLNEQQATIKSKDKQLERLYNYFQDYLKDEMSGNAFSEMWDFVKETESWEDE